MDNKKGVWILTLILVAAASRLVPHLNNFTMVGALAIFGGSVINHKVLKYVLPLIALFLSDIILNNFVLNLNANGGISLAYPGMLWVYGAFVVMTFLGSLVNRNKLVSILGTAIGSTLLFYLITNFGTWTTGLYYPMSFSGLIACYVAGIPFIGGTLLGTVIYSFILFGAYNVLTQGKLAFVKA